MTIGDNKDYIRALSYSYYTTITGWGVLLTDERLFAIILHRLEKPSRDGTPERPQIANCCKEAATAHLPPHRPHPIKYNYISREYVSRGMRLRFTYRSYMRMSYIGFRDVTPMMDKSMEKSIEHEKANGSRQRVI